MKNSLKLGALLCFLSVFLFASCAKSEVQHLSKAKTSYQVNQSHCSGIGVAQPATHSVTGFTAGGFSPALHQTQATITNKAGYGVTVYKDWAPRTGSYYYLMGTYWSPGSNLS